MTKHHKELRVTLPHDDLWLLRAKAAQAGMSVPQYIRNFLHDGEERKEVRKNDYRLF